MRLQEYITESLEQDIDKFVSNVKKDCKPWLSAIKTCKNKALYRGYKGKKIDHKKVRMDRRPTDMPYSKHEELDLYFLDEFGWPARSQGLFATTAIGITNQYGDPGLCFPAGKFQYIWNPYINDLYIFMKNFEGTLDRFMKDYTDKDLHKFILHMEIEICVLQHIYIMRELP